MCQNWCTITWANRRHTMILIGDEEFALKTYLMKPFPRRQSRNNERLDTYNYRLCRARRVVENAFGI